MIWFFVVVGVAGFGVTLGIAWNMGYSHGCRETDRSWRQGIVRAGVARWTVDDNGNPRWSWDNEAIARAKGGDA